jgi:outer membrane immunogenic protein
MMRRISLALLAALGMSVAGVCAGSAADLPLKAAAPAMISPVSAYNWSGFYVGAHAGDGWGTTESTAILSAALLAAPGGFNLPVSSQTFNGFLGGFQGGYNWQAGVLVLGVEGDFSFAGLRGNAPCLIILSCQVRHDWVADITGRVGVVAFDRALVYIKGGAAWADSNYNINTSIAGASISGSASTTRLGGLLGFGVEYPFLPRWTAKLEYNFISFGNQTLNFPIGITPPLLGVSAVNVPAQINESMHIIKGGVNYHF